MMVDVCEGVAHMHDHGFVHSDLKFPNVLLQEICHKRFVAKVSDLGLAHGERRQNPPSGDHMCRCCSVLFLYLAAR